jgi:hypothetical protein
VSDLKINNWPKLVATNRPLATEAHTTRLLRTKVPFSEMFQGLLLFDIFHIWEPQAGYGGFDRDHDRRIVIRNLLYKDNPRITTFELSPGLLGRNALSCILALLFSSY